LLSPRLWSRFYRAKKGETKERSHQDGIKIGLSSHEALEEYFFKAQSRDAYIHEDRLTRHHLDPNQAEEYLHYQTLIREKEDDVYLAKNNNFLLRYRSMRAAHPDFKMLILFRDPLSHASSLLEKHQHYLNVQQEDRFVLEYMNWLGHHEFGQGQKAFDFGTRALPEGHKLELDYWLQVWINYYQEALLINDANCLFVAYDTFCQKPALVLDKVQAWMGLSKETVNHPKPFQNPRNLEGLSPNPAYLAEAQKVFALLKERAFV